MTTTTAAADDARIARLHLRVGLLRLAHAELEELASRRALDAAELAALAEARWREGDLRAAGEAATACLDAGGEDPVAIVVAAEAAAADGHPGLARTLADRLAGLDAAMLGGIFRGMPHRAFWPAAPAVSPAAETLFGSPGLPGEHAPDHLHVHAAPAGPRPAGPGAAALWSDEADRGGTIAEASQPHRHGHDAGHHLHPDPSHELARAREDLALDIERACLRLSLVLRSDPALAPAVLEALALRREPVAAVVRGDAQRLLGRHLEAEAAYAQAAAALERGGGPALPPPPPHGGLPRPATGLDATARAMRRRRPLPGRDVPGGREPDDAAPAPGQTALPIPPEDAPAGSAGEDGRPAD